MEDEKDEKSLQLDIADFEDIRCGPDLTKMEYLVVVSERALCIHNRSVVKNGKMTAVEKRVEEDNPDQFNQRMVKNGKMTPVEKRDEEDNHDQFKMVKFFGRYIRVNMKDNEIQPKTREQGRSRAHRGSTSSGPVADEHQEKSEEEEEEEGKRNKRQRRNIAIARPNSSPQLPQQYRTVLDRFAAGKTIQELNLILTKNICQTDISRTHCRLSLPKNKEGKYSFLTEEEEKYLKLMENGKRVPTSLEVDVIDPSFEICKLQLKNWAVSKGIYVLTTKYWNDVVERNSIQIGETFQIWTVRVNQKLCFILVRVLEAEDDQD